MAEKHELVCISCPIGCRLTVTKEGTEKWLVEGNACKRGEVYGIKEVTNPVRMLPTTVKIKDGVLNRLPVKTREAIQKELIFEAMEVINKACVTAPIKMGDIIVKNLLDTNIDVIATRSMNKK